MMKIKNWFKKKMAILSLAMSNVEKNALGQNSEGQCLRRLSLRLYDQIDSF